MKLIITFTLTVILALHVHAQDIFYAKEVVKTLTSPEFKGRGYVDNGDRIAAEYIKKQFISIGLKPFGNDYFQPFNVRVNSFPSKMKLTFNNTELIPGVEFIVDAASSSATGKFSVFTVKKQDLLDDNKLKNAIQSSAGKLLLIDERGFKTENNEEKKKADDIVRFLKQDPQIKSKGTIIHTSEKLMWRGSTIQSPKPSVIVNTQIDTDLPATVKMEIEAKLLDHQTQNVAGYIEGTQQPDSFLVVLAHYDHLGKMGSHTYFPGANDNASGTAMILNLAKHFKANPHKYSVVFIALAAEEIGILGAKYFVANPLFSLDKVVFLVNFDMAGTGDDGIKVVNGSVHQAKFDLLTRLNDANGYLKSVQIRGAACNSDHCPFHEKGVPSFYIYTLGGNTAYHDIHDKYETLPFTEFTDYFQLMTNFFEQFR